MYQITVVPPFHFSFTRFGWTLCCWLSFVLEPDAVLHTDLPGSDHKTIDHLFKTFGLHMAILHGESITQCEFTIVMVNAHRVICVN